MGIEDVDELEDELEESEEVEEDVEVEDDDDEEDEVDASDSDSLSSSTFLTSGLTTRGLTATTAFFLATGTSSTGASDLFRFRSCDSAEKHA